MYSTLKIHCTECNEDIFGAHLHAHMAAQGHSNYRSFAIGFSFYNMREALVAKLTMEMNKKRKEIGAIFDRYGISSELIPELAVSAPVDENASAIFTLSTSCSSGNFQIFL